MTHDRELAPLALIVAMARNGVIGNEGALPWRIPEDLKHFKKTTLGHAVIMGRKTFESIGHPLSSRRNIVISRRVGTGIAGCEVTHSLPAAIDLARTSDDCPFVIGGASVYEEALPLTTEIHLTTIDQDFDGDTRFPTDLASFEEVEARPGTTEGVTFRLLRRKD